MTKNLMDSPYLYDIKVFNRNSGSLVGRVIDMDNMRITVASTNRVPLNQTVQLALEDTLQMVPGRKASFVATCMGCQEDEAFEGIFDLDFSYDDLSTEMKEMINSLQ